MKIDYNAPVVLTFAIAIIVVQLVSALLLPALIPTFFAVRSTFAFTNPLDYLRLISHVLGHGSFAHLSSNLLFILLLGPVLEEKYGSTAILSVILVTALSTGLINVLFFPTSLMGASGVVFAFIILVSIVNVRRGTIPLTFVLVFILFIGGEVVQGLAEDKISQMAHIVGGIIGAVYGFTSTR